MMSPEEREAFRRLKLDVKKLTYQLTMVSIMADSCATVINNLGVTIQDVASKPISCNQCGLDPRCMDTCNNKDCICGLYNEPS